MKFRYSLIALIAVIATAAFSASTIWSVFKSKPIPLTSGQTAHIEVAAPSDIIVLYYTESVVNGVYLRSDTPPEGVIIHASYAGQQIPVQVDRSTTMSMGDGERRSLFTIPAGSAGSYQLLVDNIPAEFRFTASVGSGMGRFILGIAAGGGSVMFLIVAVVLFALAIGNVVPKTKTEPNK